ncbi:sugar transferase [bacterium]|nr:MAG: sugar transferase [bacterium]
MKNVILRIIEIIIALLLMIITAPLFLLAVIVAMVDSPGKILLKQDRVGKNGKVFKLFKLRTMKKGANGDLPMHTQVNDPRFSPVCRFIRSTCIDEIPQFWNILKGEMTFIGPRPERPPIVEAYTERQRDILNFTPGLFGISQLVFREGVVVSEKIDVELQYYENRTIWKDSKILFYTPIVLLAHVAGKVRPGKFSTNHKHSWLKRAILGQEIS